MVNYLDTEVLGNWNRQQYHIPCLAHIINLAVQAFWDEMKAVSEHERLEVNFNEEVFPRVAQLAAGFKKTLEKVRELSRLSRPSCRILLLRLSRLSRRILLLKIIHLQDRFMHNSSELNI